MRRSFIDTRSALLLCLLPLLVPACGDDSAETPSSSAATAADSGLDASITTARDAGYDARAHPDSATLDSATPVGTGKNAGIGQNCDEDSCPTGLTCERSDACSAVDFSCPKVCVRHVGDCEGDPCGDAAYCRPLFMYQPLSDAGLPDAGFSSGQRMVVDATCFPKSKPGERCSPPRDVNPCVTGYSCQVGSDGEQSCQP
jgi:hypothetical protein